MSILASSTSNLARRALAVSAPRSFSTAPVARLAAAAGAVDSQGPWADRPSASRLNRYLIVAEDHSDVGANARRLEVRERHLEQAQNGKKVGRIELGGAMLRRDFDQIDQDVGPGPHMGGSAMIVLAESIDDVYARVMQDEYVQGNVWDLNKLKIYPFLQAPLASSASTSAEESTEASADAGSRSASANANATLGQLRQDLAAGKGPKIVTLGALRRMHQKVPRSVK